jgi:hypothetical protein
MLPRATTDDQQQQAAHQLNRSGQTNQRNNSEISWRVDGKTEIF